MGFISDINLEYQALGASRKDCRNLGLIFLAALLILAGVLYWNHIGYWRHSLIAGACFGLLGLAAPGILKPLHRVWMTFALVMGWFMARILLALLFYLVVTPIGLVMRLLGKDLLDRRMADRKSYWHRRPAGEYRAKQTEKMF
jgi:hypothetical protein